MQSEKIEVSKFLAYARSFCSYIESKAIEEPIEFLKNVHRLLLKLYDLGQELPEINGNSNEFQDFLTQANYNAILENINRRSPFQYYWTILEPFNFENTNQEIGTGDIIDDIGDIYRDIKKSLLLLDSGIEENQADAMWHIKFDFDSHWSTHCIDSIKAIHDYTQLN